MRSACRGFVPEDERNFSAEAIGKMRDASKDLLYLVNRGYPVDSASTFVGNRFLFSQRQRLALVRSIADDAALRARGEKRLSAEDLRDRQVFVDGFNIIITLEVWKSGGILLSGMDGAVRDLASLRGTYRIIDETQQAAEELLSHLKKTGVREAVIYLDEPVSNSGRLKALLAEEAEKIGLPVDIRVEKDVDHTLYGRECVITSDSVILDHCSSWYSLGAALIPKEKILRVYDALEDTKNVL